jgi:hypothetical protein
MLIKEGRVQPSELGINMKDPVWAFRYLNCLMYMKKQEQKNMNRNTYEDKGNSLSYHISPEEEAKL